MQDGDLQTLCYPSLQKIPRCGWSDFTMASVARTTTPYDRPTASRSSAPTQVRSDPYRLHVIPNMGLKSFATRPIRTGTILWLTRVMLPDSCCDNRADPVSSICQQDDSPFSLFFDASASGRGAITCRDNNRQQVQAYFGARRPSLGNTVNRYCLANLTTDDVRRTALTTRCESSCTTPLPRTCAKAPLEGVRYATNPDSRVLATLRNQETRMGPHCKRSSRMLANGKNLICQV